MKPNSIDKYPDHPELLERVLQEIQDTPIEEYDARIARYERETHATREARKAPMAHERTSKELAARAGVKV